MSTHQMTHPMNTEEGALESRCELLRTLHVPGDPLVLVNAWDVGSALAVVEADFPVVATTSGGVAASLGFQDHEGAPVEEMLAAASRIAHAVDVPVTIDAEAGYGMEPADLVAALRGIGAAGCNLEDTNHATGDLVARTEHAAWLSAVRDAATDQGYGLVINARVDVFLAAYGDGDQTEVVGDALERAHAYFEAGVDCVYPIALRDPDVLRTFVSEAGGPTNVLPIPHGSSVAELVEVGVARISYASLLYRQTMEQFRNMVRDLAG